MSIALLQGAKLVSGKVDDRAIVRASNLVLAAAPLRVVDTINPVLGLEDDAAVLLDVGRAGISTLGLVSLGLRVLGRNGAVLAVAGVDLHGGLVGGNLHGDTGLVGGDTDHGNNRVLGGVGGRAVDDPAGVVAGAASAAQTGGLVDVLADELGLGEVQSAIVGGVHVRDLAGGDEDAISSNEALGEGHLQGGIVQDGGVLERVEVPVDVVGKHDGGLLGQSHRHQLGGQLGQTLRVLRRLLGGDTVDGVGDHVTGEVLKALIEEGEGNGRVSVRSDRPIAHVVADKAAVEGVEPTVLVLRDVVLMAINGEGSVLDTVRVATHDSTEESAVGFAVVQVVLGVIVANDDILHFAITVWHQERSQTSTVRDQRGGDVIRFDRVGLEVVVARAGTRGR